MKFTVKLSKEEKKWLETFDDNFHVALVKIKSGCTTYKDLEAQHEEIKDEIRALKQGY